MRKVKIYSDGSCIVDKKIGGTGTILIDVESGTEKELMKGYFNTTNNRMELRGVILGLKALNQKCEVEIYTDSSYIVNSINKGWVRNWLFKKNFAEKANEDLWRTLIPLFDKHQSKIFHVKGHADNEWNNRCDQLARFSYSRFPIEVDEDFRFIESNYIKI